MVTLKETRGPFFKKVERETDNAGQMSEMEKFVKFWWDIWEKDDRTPEMPGMGKVSEQLRGQITNVKEFNITKRNHWKRNKEKENLDWTWNRWYSKFLVEEVKTSKKGIEEIIWTSQRQQRFNNNLVVFKKHYAAHKNDRANWREELLSDNVFEYIMQAPNMFSC